MPTENAGSKSVQGIRTVKLRNSLRGSPNIGFRQSPRLAAIAKVHNSPILRTSEVKTYHAMKCVFTHLTNKICKRSILPVFWGL